MENVTKMVTLTKNKHYEDFMDLEKMPSDVQFVFKIMMQAALKVKSMGQPKTMFVKFASECWDSMLLNDEDELREILNLSMLDDIKKFAEKL